MESSKFDIDRDDRTRFTLWLDDERPAPPGYDIHVRTAPEAIALIESGRVAAISFDNDLGDPSGMEGRHVARRMEELAFHGLIPPIRCKVHTMNPVARMAIVDAVRNAERYWMAGAEPVVEPNP